MEDMCCEGCNRHFIRRKNFDKHKRKCKSLLSLIEEREMLEKKGTILNIKIDQLNKELDLTFGKEHEIRQKICIKNNPMFKKFKDDISVRTLKLSYVFELYNRYSDENNERIVKVLIELLEEPIDNIISLACEYRRQLETIQV